MDIYLRGLIIGITIAAPVGPIGVLCIQRTLVEGKLSGLVSGIGAASADAIYGIVAGFGLSFISSFLTGQLFWLRLAGGFFLFYLGVRTFTSKPAPLESPNQSRGLWGNYLSTLLLTLTNPMTILSFTGIFAGMGVVQKGGDYGRALLMVLGVFSGSALWWLVLSQGIGLFRAHVTARGMIWLNRLAGSLIFLLGFLALINLRTFNSPL